MNWLKNKKLFIFLFLIGLIGFGGYSYIYKSHKKIEFKNAKNEYFWYIINLTVTGDIKVIKKNLTTNVRKKVIFSI